MTEWRDPGNPIQIGSYSFPHGMPAGTETGGETVDGSTGTASIAVERVNLATRQLATTVRVPLGVPVMVGGMGAGPTEAAEAPSTDEGDAPQPLYLVIEIRIAEK